MKNIQRPTPNAQRLLGAGLREHGWLKVEAWWLNVPKFVLIFAVRGYRLIISPAQTHLFGPSGGCRFTPTCSVYAMDAVREHGAIKGAALAVSRICRCHPWGGCGHDPVPKAEGGKISHPAH